MEDEARWPTPYGDVNDVLAGFLEAGRSLLGERLVGMYLYGSLATGDFHPDRSDVDFVTVTEGELTAGELEGLIEMHDRFAMGGSAWAMEIDGSYIPREAMRRYDRERAVHPHIERRVGKLRMEHFKPDWVIQRHVLRECGVTLAGPAPETLIDPVGRDEIRRAVRLLTLDAWAPVADDASELTHRGGQVYAILTMFRVLHTLETGEVVSKQAAGRWAVDTLGERWRPLLEGALEWKKTVPQESGSSEREEVAALVRLAVERWSRSAA